MANDPDKFETVLAKIRKTLSDLRRLISGAREEKLDDLDSLLSVAQAEVDRHQKNIAKDD